jgi:transcription termination factor Rho
MRPPDLLCSGILELHPQGHGFLRDPARSFRQMPTDPRVEAALLARYELRPGARLTGHAEPNAQGSGRKLVELIHARVTRLRRTLAGMNTTNAMESLQR